MTPSRDPDPIFKIIIYTIIHNEDFFIYFLLNLFFTFSCRLHAQTEYFLFTEKGPPVLSEEWSRLDISTEVGEYEKYIKGREDDSAAPVDPLRHHSELPEIICARFWAIFNFGVPKMYLNLWEDFEL